MYFVITNASDKKFARKFGTIRADSLEEAPAAAVETATFKKGKWTFFEDPGLVNRFDPASPATFDPFQMDDKGVTCSNFAAEVTGNGDGFIADLDHLDDLIDEGVVVQTEAPAGLRLDSPLQPPLIVNCPVPLTVHY